MDDMPTTEDLEWMSALENEEMLNKMREYNEE